MSTIADCPLVEISGAPRERGRQHGEAARDRIRLGVAHYAEQLAGDRMQGEALTRAVQDFVPTIDRFDASYCEEMRGISEGAHVPFESVVLLNCRTEILKIAKQAAALSEARKEPDGCTGIVALQDPDPLTVFDNVYAEPHTGLARQRDHYSRYLRTFVGGDGR